MASSRTSERTWPRWRAESGLYIQALRVRRIQYRPCAYGASSVSRPSNRAPVTIATPYCECGEEEETVQHVLEGCTINPGAYELQRKEGPTSSLIRRLQEGD